MKTIDINIQDAADAAVKEKFDALRPEADEAVSRLEDGTGEGADFLGWVKLPSATPEKLMADINATAGRLRRNCDFVVCIGIGGSYLGAKAVISALSDSFADFRAPAPGSPKVLFAGQNIGEEYIHELKSLLDGRRFGIIVISKSGTTTEPAIAFRILKDMLVAQAGADKAKELIVAVTDEKKGALRTLAGQEGYETYVIPDDVGGRYSVLTAVGLLPIAVAGFDIRALLSGAADMQTACANPGSPAQLYAKTRNALYRDGKKIEILVNYHPKLHFFGEWWKQLYGESEGKDHKGIFPAAVDNSTDLHSMGQFIQDGNRNLFETVIDVGAPAQDFFIEDDPENLDGLNFLSGQEMSKVNRRALEGTILAHTQGGVPNMVLELPDTSEYEYGYMVYFFEKACGLSGYLLGVNPFDQPGVEAYKKNMFALLGKPVFE